MSQKKIRKILIFLLVGFGENNYDEELNGHLL